MLKCLWYFSALYLASDQVQQFDSYGKVRNMMIDDSFFWFRRNRLILPGVRGEHVLMHITDTHLNVCDALSTADEREKVKEQEALWDVYKEKFATGNGEPYGDAQRISTLAAFDRLLALAEELKPEVLLLSGDNLDYMHPAGERYLAKRLGAYDGKFICVPGNHEAEACAGAWDSGVRAYEFEGFRIVAVDNRNRTVTRPDLDALRTLCSDPVPIILLCHVPILTACCGEKLRGVNPYFVIDAETADENAREFISLCVSSDAIRAILCGHVHGYHAVEFAPGKPQIVGSQGMAGAVHLFTVAQPD